jgi:hypothetical protein
VSLICGNHLLLLNLRLLEEKVGLLLLVSFLRLGMWRQWMTSKFPHLVITIISWYSSCCNGVRICSWFSENVLKVFIVVVLLLSQVGINIGNGFSWFILNIKVWFLIGISLELTNLLNYSWMMLLWTTATLLLMRIVTC